MRPDTSTFLAGCGLTVEVPMSGVWGMFGVVRTAKTIAVAIMLFVYVEPTPKCWAQNVDLSSGARMVVSRRASDGFLNVRSDPDADAKIVGRFNIGDQIVTTGKVVSRGSTRWYQVRGGTRVGWVNGFYLDKVPAVERAPAVAGYRSNGLEDAGTRWTLNGSTLVLTVDGDVWTFRYLEPRQGLVEEGVRRGTLLFKGREDETGLIGTAYRFSKRCGARAYEVRGEFHPEGTLTLEGAGPRGLGRSCEVTQTEDYVLDFHPLE